MVANMILGVRRVYAYPVQRKAAANAVTLTQVLTALAGEGCTPCDRAMLCFGVACCLRPSRLVAPEVAGLKRVAKARQLRTMAALET